MLNTKCRVAVFVTVGLGGAACQTEYKAAATEAMNGSGLVAGSGGSAAAQPGGGGTAGSSPIGGGGTAGPSGVASAVASGAGGLVTAAGGTAGSSVVGEGAGGQGPPGSGGTLAGSGGAANAGGAVPPPVQCPATAVAPGTTQGTVQAGGTTRQYILHVPPGYTGKTPVPLVTDWHPILSDDNYEEGASGYLQKADKEGFVVAFPNGIDNAWNVGPCCTSSRTVDDVGFARALVAKLEGQLCIDPKRIYAVGYSMGGGMSYKLACDAADLFAGVAPAAFELMADNEWPCHPSRPITVIAFNGTADVIVPYNGGASSPPNGLPITNHFIGAQATFAKWAELDGCTDTPADKGGGCKTYSQCQSGVEVTSCIKQGGGHETGDPNVAWATLQRFTLP